MSGRFDKDRLRHALWCIDELLEEGRAAAGARADELAGAPPERQLGARNLAYYLAVRTHDLRLLQRELADLSLSSLGRMEANVEYTLRGVRLALLGLLGELPAEVGADSLTAEQAATLLGQHTASLLGPAPAQRQTRIMVTLPTEAVQDRTLLRELLAAGMDVVRINLAHDSPEAWSAMIAQLRAAEAGTGRRCQVLVDLPGPKLRTGELPPGPRVRRVKPERDERGRVVQPVRVLFGDAAAGAAAVPLTTPLATMAQPGDVLEVVDARARARRFCVQSAQDGVLGTTGEQTAYLETGCAVGLLRGERSIATARIGELPALAGWLPLRPGDFLSVCREQVVGRQATPVAPARIACTLPEVFTSVQTGQRILFDDGRIAGVIEANDGDELRVRITDTPPRGGRLRAEKGINLPDTDLHLSALTGHDLGCLDWVAAHADAVGMSFVQRPADVLRLQQELDRRGRPDLGVVLKIETAKAFQRLPELLFAGLRSRSLGVMVARGDLAVEVGYARLAEVQEEILWLCEAAHVPVIWATQVLDSMAKNGVPSRAEVTDAAMGVQTECVMLNKGPCIVQTTGFLGGVLERMQQHRTKKRSLLRALRVAGVPRPSPQPPPGS